MTATLIQAPPAPPAGRRSGIGASEIAAIIGEHPHITERELALRKRGHAPDQPQTDAMSWGHRMEAVGAEEYAARTGRALLPGRTFTSERWPHVFATPDRLVAGERRGVELKYTRRWDEPPRHVRVQALTQTAIADLDVVDVVRMGPYGDPSWTSIEHDAAEAVALLDWAEEWWARYVDGDELPDPDGSEASRRWAESHLGTGLMRATDEQVRLMGSLRSARHDKAAAEAEEARLRDLLCRSMAGHDELEAVDGSFRVIWRQAKGRTTTDWRSVADSLRRVVEAAGLPVDVDTLVSIATQTGEPTRPFKPTWEEE